MWFYATCWCEEVQTMNQMLQMSPHFETSCEALFLEKYDFQTSKANNVAVVKLTGL